MDGPFLGEPEGHPEHEMLDTEVPIAGPELVLPSVESSSDAAVTAAESEFLTVSAFDPQFRGLFPLGVNQIHIQITNGIQPGYDFICGFLHQLRKTFSEKFAGLDATALSTSLTQNLNLNISTLRNSPANSLLDDMLTVRSVRSMFLRNPGFSPPRRRPPAARAASPPSNRATGNSRVLKPQQATPIRRSRSSYSIISQNRRTEASGRIDRTLYRLPDLLSQNESTNASPPTDVHHDMGLEENGPMTGPMTPPTHTPTAPMTAPAAATTASDPDNSPSFPRWIFNNLSRRWTSIRERWGTRQDTDASRDAEPVPAPASPTAPTVSTTVMEITAPGAAAGSISLPRDEILSRPTPPRRPRRESLHLPQRTGVHRPPRRRRTSNTTQPAPDSPPVRRRPAAASTTRTKRPYDLYPGGFSPELLERCYAGSTNRPTKPPTKLPGSEVPDVSSAQVTPSLEATETSQGSEIPAPNEDQNLKRKREPETIPNPKGCSYGMDMDYFEFTEEEWAEEEKRQAELDSTKQFAPAAKKQRVDDPKEQRRRLTTRTTPSHVSSRRPGFIPNRRGTYQAPELPTIESSGLSTDSDSSPISQPPYPAAPANVSPTSDDARLADGVSKPSRSETVIPPAGTKKPSTPAHQEYQETVDGADAHENAAAVTTTDAADVARDTGEAEPPVNDPSPLTRARNKAQQFKPKTPSRLRESHPFSSSQISLKTATPSNLSEPMSLDDTLSHLPTAEDIDWLHELCPTGDMSNLVWPEKVSLVETLNLDPSAVAIVEQHANQQKLNEAVSAWKDLFDTFVENDLEL